MFSDVQLSYRQCVCQVQSADLRLTLYNGLMLFSFLLFRSLCLCTSLELCTLRLSDQVCVAIPVYVCPCNAGLSQLASFPYGMKMKIFKTNDLCLGPGTHEGL